MIKKNVITSYKNNSKKIIAKKIPVIEQLPKINKKKKKKKIFIILFLIILLIAIGIIILSLFEKSTNKLLDYCEPGYIYTDGYCEIYLNEPATENIVCLNNYHEENGDCVIYLNAFKYEDCPSGYWFLGGKCKKSGTLFDYSKCGYYSTYDSWSNTCYAYVTPTVTYSCSSGILQGSRCRVINNEEKSIKYDCSEGYYYDSILNVCQKYIKKDLDGKIIN